MEATSASHEPRIDDAASFKINAMRGVRRRRSSVQSQRLSHSVVKRSARKIHHVSRNCPIHGKKAKAAAAAAARTKRVAPSSSPHSTPCMFTRIMNFIVAKTVGYGSRGSNSSNSAFMNWQRLVGCVDCNGRPRLSQRAKMEIGFIIHHLRLIAQVEALESKERCLRGA